MLKRKTGAAAVLSAMIFLLMPLSVFAKTDKASDLRELAKVVSEHGVKREASFDVKYKGDMADIETIINDGDFIFFESTLAMVDDPGTHEDADYLAATLNLSSDAYSVEADGDVVTFKLPYFETLEQANYVKQKVPGILSELGVSSMGNYEKVKAIHDYVCNLITYTGEPPEANSSMYNALSKGEGLCNAYALCMYRLCVEAGVPCKFVGGKAGTGRDADAHAWNIVALGDKWYYVDATWDDSTEGISYDYFLKGSSDFDAADKTQPHTLEKAYGTGEFASAFPIAGTAFKEGMDDVNNTVKIGSDDYDDPTPTPTPTTTPTPTPTPTETPTPTPVPVDSIVITPSSATVNINESVTLTAEGVSAGAAVTWSSSDEKIASVKDGVVTGVAVGTATITASDGSKSGTAVITVTDGQLQIDYTIEVKDSEKLKADAKIKSFKVSEPGIVKCKMKGKKLIVKGKNPGIVEIAAYDKHGDEIGYWVVEVIETE